MSNGAPAFAEPLSTAVPRDAARGSGSPVSVLVSITACSLITVPSTGITSPVRTIRTSPVLYLLDRKLLEPVSDTHLRELRRPLNQRRQLAPRAA
jgi:hypothetical protein